MSTYGTNDPHLKNADLREPRSYCHTCGTGLSEREIHRHDGMCEECVYETYATDYLTHLTREEQP